MTRREIADAEQTIERLRADNQILQDGMDEYFGKITDDERKELFRLRLGYKSLLNQMEWACGLVTKLTGRDPRLPDREGDTTAPAQAGPHDELVKRLNIAATPLEAGKAGVLPTRKLYAEAASVITQQAAEIERLRGIVYADQVRSVLDAVTTERDDYKRKLGEAVKALEPFALVAEMDIGPGESDEDKFRPMGLLNYAPHITVGHMRAALALLARLTEGK